jgi:hypothetical protein
MISEAGKINVRDRIKMIESQSPRRTQSHMSLSSRNQTRNFHPKIKAQSQNDLRYTANDHRAQELSMQSIKKFDQDRNIEPPISTIIRNKAQEFELDSEVQRKQDIKDAEEKEAALYGQTLNTSRYEPKVIKDPRRQTLSPESAKPSMEPEQQVPQPKVEEISMSGSRGNTRSLRRIESKKMDHFDIVSIPIIPEPTVFEAPVVVVAAADPPTPVVHKQMVITETISLAAEGSNFLSIESFDLVTVDDNVQPMERNSPCNSDNSNPRDAVMVSTHEEHGIQVAIRNESEENRHSYEIRVNVEQQQPQQPQQWEEPVVEICSPTAASAPGPALALKKVDSMPMTDDSSIDSLGSSLLYDGSNNPDDDKKKIRFSNRVDIREISDRGSNSSASSAYDRQVRQNREKRSFWLRFICSAN